MATVRESLSQTAARLALSSIASPRLEAERLLSEALDLSRSELYLDSERSLTQRELSRIEEYADKRAKGMPLAYIVGQVSFFGCSIEVGPDVLIPRQETELLVDRVVAELKSKSGPLSLWDLCSGSGCIAIAIKNALPFVQVSLSDLSERALSVAKRNADQNRVEVSIRKGDLFEPYKGEKADYIVCNPPYVAEERPEELDVEVASFEPALALWGGGDGLLYYRRIAEEIGSYLKPDGVAWFEIGASQGSAVEAIFRKAGFLNLLLEKDWSGRDRFFRVSRRVLP